MRTEFIPLALICIASIFILISSIFRKRYISLFDFFVIFSTFYVYIRPLTVDYCADIINRNIYLWDSEYYSTGNIISGLGLLCTQIGYLTKKTSKIHIKEFSLDGRAEILLKILKHTSILYIATFITLFAIYGQALLSPFRDTGAVSANLPGFEYAWPIIRILSFSSISLSLFFSLTQRKPRYLFYFLLLVSLSLILGRRGMLTSPIMFAIFLYGYIQSFQKIQFINFTLNLRALIAIACIIIIVFFGKDIFSISKEIEEKKESNIRESICNIVKSGHQEFDLLWPAIIDTSKEVSVLNLPSAMFGSFIPHQDRLDGNKIYYSATDTLMMKYNPDAFYYLKFGISPNFFQFYYIYTGVFAFIIFFFFGFYYRTAENKLIFSFFVKRNGFFSANLILLLLNYFSGPIDFTFKYFIASLFCLALTKLVISFTAKIRL